MGVLSDNARILLSEDSYPGELLGAIHALRDEFARITGIGEVAREHGDGTPIILDSGTAIAPVDAARCILDFARTTRFLRGLRDAIDEARDRRAGERVRVLYAGCGPWAPLVLPLCTVLDPAEVGITLLDIHERSIRALRELVDHFGLHAFIDDVVQGDATSIRLGFAPHVIVAEVMQAALREEPQLAVTANLVSQLARDGIFLPRRVEVLATAADIRAETEFTPDESGVGVATVVRHEIGRLIDLTPASAGPLLASGRDGLLPAVQYSVPDLPTDREFHLMLRTRVSIHGRHELADYDSGLTYPVVRAELGALEAGAALEFRYRVDRQPGFDVVRHTAPGIRPIEPRDHLTVLALNIESEHFLSPMNGRRLAELIGWSRYHRVLEVDGCIVAFLIALGPGASYGSPNYQWFDRDRSDFLYVDRVVVGAMYRGRGHASALYDDLFRFAREQGLHEVVCEFDIDPPNPASQAFHASYGFAEVGTREQDGRLLSMQVATLRQR